MPLLFVRKTRHHYRTGISGFNGVNQPNLDGQTKVYYKYPYSTYGDFCVYVYPNVNLEPNGHYCHATMYANQTTYIWNKKPQIVGTQNGEDRTSGNRCMGIYVTCAIDNAGFNCFKKVNGDWESQNSLATCSHLVATSAWCKEYKGEAFNSSNAGSSKSYVIYWCMNGSSCMSCNGDRTIFNQ